jgi:hypothetical protein
MPLLAALVFCLWLAQQPKILSVGTFFALLSVSLFTLSLVIALSRLVESMQSQESFRLATTDSRRDRLTAWGMLLGFGIAVCLLEYGLVYKLSDTEMDFLPSFFDLYYRSDVAHYMGIAENWYVNTGDERLRLVFLPLYSLAIRLLTWNGDYFSGAFITALVFSFACLPAAYELFRLDMDRWDAMACTRLLFLLPGAAFLRIPMSEGLFLFLTILAVYAARKRRFWLSGLFTALSAFTRSLGILLLGLLCVEMLFAFLESWRRDRREAAHLIPKYIGCLLLGSCGTLLYLLINWQVSGDPLTFLTYQRENWQQQLGLFFNTAAYQSEYALEYYWAGDMESLFSLSLPNQLCCFGVLGLLCADRKRMRISYLVWSLIYYAVAVGPSWLLSGPRYLAMLFPLTPILRRFAKKPAHEFVLESLLLLCQTTYLLMLALNMYVY